LPAQPLHRVDNPGHRACKSWCAGNNATWIKKCATFANCAGCNECYMPPPPNPPVTQSSSSSPASPAPPPRAPPWHPGRLTQLGSCAIVASGGSLRGSKCGAEIDAHNAVLRINTPMINGTFAPDVGWKWKTTLHALNEELTEQLSASPTPTEYASEDSPWDRRPFLANVADLISFAEDHDWIDAFGRAAPGIRRTLGATGLYEAPAQLRLFANDYMRNVHYNDRWAMLPTKGFYAVVLMLAMCDTVDLYGFKDELPWQNYHYWDASPEVNSRWGASDVHDVQLEHLVFDAWNGSGSNAMQVCVDAPAAPNPPSPSAPPSPSPLPSSPQPPSSPPLMPPPYLPPPSSPVLSPSHPVLAPSHPFPRTPATWLLPVNNSPSNGNVNAMRTAWVSAAIAGLLIGMLTLNRAAFTRASRRVTSGAFVKVDDKRSHDRLFDDDGAGVSSKRISLGEDGTNSTTQTAAVERQTQTRKETAVGALSKILLVLQEATKAKAPRISSMALSRKATVEEEIEIAPPLAPSVQSEANLTAEENAVIETWSQLDEETVLARANRMLKQANHDSKIQVVRS